MAADHAMDRRDWRRRAETAPALGEQVAQGSEQFGIAGAFLAVFGVFLKKNAVVCINDPRLEDSLAHENF